MFIRRLTAEKNWFIDWVQQWDQLWTDCNWYDCDLLWIRFENDKVMGGYEFTFIVLGLGFRWRWNHMMTDSRKDMEETIAGLREGTVTTRPWSEVRDEILNSQVHPETLGLQQIVIPVDFENGEKKQV